MRATGSGVRTCDAARLAGLQQQGLAFGVYDLVDVLGLLAHGLAEADVGVRALDAVRPSLERLRPFCVSKTDLAECRFSRARPSRERSCRLPRRDTSPA